MSNKLKWAHKGACSSIFTLLVLSNLGCHSKGENAQMAAKVGSAILTREEVQKRMALEGLNPDRENEFIENWINEELLVQEARRQGIEKTDELKWEMEKIEKQYIINQLVEKTFAEKIKLNDANISDFYEKNKSLFLVEEDEVRLLHIMNKTQTDAELTLQEIRAGKPFEQVARERSIDPFRDKGGDMGFVGRNDVIPEISRVAFSLQEGGLSPILRSNQGYHIIKVFKKHAKGETRDLSEIRDEISQRLRVNNERAVYYDLLYQLKNKQKVYSAESTAQLPESDHPNLE
jgi:peptidyl-prolyl cis-trans isomerase C